MTTYYEILTWHGIPTGVRASDEAGQVVEHLPPRFQVAVDAVAMSAGLTEYEDYLAGWRYSEPMERAGSAPDVARTVAEEVASRYPPKRVRELRRALEAKLPGS